MKSPTQKTLVLSFILASVFALPVVAQSEMPKSDAPAVKDSEQDNNKVNGKVSAKTDDSITVNNQDIKVDAITTVVTKGGTTGKLDDIKVGDKVQVSTIHALDGKLQAVKVEVQSSK